MSLADALFLWSILVFMLGLQVGWEICYWQMHPLWFKKPKKD